jgi:N-acetylneuraminate synthase
MVAFSTPFDRSAVDFLEDLNVPCYKIASFENTDLGLIKYAASTGKPMIISTGMATIGEISAAVETARNAGCDELCLLKCTSAYPADPSSSNLRTLVHLRQMFDVEVGLSDHTEGIGVSIASIAYGASVIERHVTNSRHDGGVDSAFSLEPTELSQLVQETDRARLALGEIRYGVSSGEEGSLVFRRSIYVVENIAAGETLTSANTRCIRPGFGLPPRYLNEVLGRRAKAFIERGTPLSLDLLD